MQPRAPSTMTQTVPCKQCSQNWVCTDTYTTIKHHQVQWDFDVYTKLSCCRNNFLKFIFIRDVQEKTIDKDTQGPLACLSSNTWPKYQAAEVNLEVSLQMIHQPFSEPEPRVPDWEPYNRCLSAWQLLLQDVTWPVPPKQRALGTESCSPTSASNRPPCHLSLNHVTDSWNPCRRPHPIGLLWFQVPTVGQK